MRKYIFLRNLCLTVVFACFQAVSDETSCVLFPVRDVVLGVPVVSLLLALRPRGGGAPHVGHAAAPQEGPPHHPGAGQRGFPGLPLRRRHHQ